MPEFVEFPKIPRLSRECIVTEKIDGTNGVVFVGEDGAVLAGSRTRWLPLTGDPKVDKSNDHFGFARWVKEHEVELREGLGPGTHFGEWWGSGIQRGYGLTVKRFSLFNTSRWSEKRPACCHVVPVLYIGPFDTAAVEAVLTSLAISGSHASPGFMRPEGVVIFHVPSRLLFKKTIEKDEEPKTGGANA